MFKGLLNAHTLTRTYRSTLGYKQLLPTQSTLPFTRHLSRTTRLHNELNGLSNKVHNKAHSKANNIATPHATHQNAKAAESLHANTNFSLLHPVSKPTKDYYLSQATSLWSRIKINTKWFLKKSMKPFNSDDISAFISWVVVSNVLIILLWTTGFTSLVLFIMNTVFAQEYLATKVGELITENTTNFLVVFENAIVPDWKGGNITFNNVFVSKRPINEEEKKNTKNFIKGSQREAVTRAKLALSQQQILVNEENFDEGNFTQYDLTIDQVNVSFSFTKWFSGKGIIDELELNGVRGVVDRTHIFWKPNDDPRNYLNVHAPGDFEIDKFTMNDVLFTIYQPNGFRPFKVSIFNCDLPQLRKHWFFYDFINANAISGTYDDSLFSIYKRYNKDHKLITTMRVDNLNVDHLNGGVKGPFGWITRGKVDMIGDVKIINKQKKNLILDFFNLKDDPFLNPKKFVKNLLKLSTSEQNEQMIINYYLKLHNVQAQVPLLTSELSYINNALIRPIVGYLNSSKAYIPIRCTIEKDVNDFAGSWTMYDSLLNDDMSKKVYEAFADYAVDEERRTIRLKRIGFWSLQALLQLLLVSFNTLT